MGCPAGVKYAELGELNLGALAKIGFLGLDRPALGGQGI
jgi:hypothetical protein